MTLLIVLSISIGVLAASIFLYFSSSPKKPETFFVSEQAAIPTVLKGAMVTIGGDLLAVVPDNFSKKSIHSAKVDYLLRASGNPWNLTKVEFFVMRIVTSMFGLIFGILIAINVSSTVTPIATYALPFVAVLVGYMYPESKYNSLAKEREIAFKVQLPEALDYLVITMSAGTHSLQNAFAKVTPYLREGVIKEEFEHIVRSVDSGMTMQGALNEFSRRVPSEGIAAFVRALNNATINNVPIESLLRNRAEASRKDLDAELDIKIERLPTKVLLWVGPAAFISLLIVVLAPSIIDIMSNM